MRYTAQNFNRYKVRIDKGHHKAFLSSHNVSSMNINSNGTTWVICCSDAIHTWISMATMMSSSPWQPWCHHLVATMMLSSPWQPRCHHLLGNHDVIISVATMMSSSPWQPWCHHLLATMMSSSSGQPWCHLSTINVQPVATMAPPQYTAGMDKPSPLPVCHDEKHARLPRPSSIFSSKGKIKEQTNTPCMHKQNLQMGWHY